MPINKSLYTFLTAQGFTGTPTIYGNTLPQGVSYPCVRFNKVATELDEILTGGKEFGTHHFQIDVFATTYAASSSLMDEIKSAIIDYSGTMGTDSVQEVSLDSEREFYEDKTEVHVISVNVRIVV